jgi:hypothetical protein
MAAAAAFSFAYLSPSSQLSLASHMTAYSLLDFARASPAFTAFLYLNIEDIIASCLRTQYGYQPSKLSAGSLPAGSPTTPQNQLLEDLPLLNMLIAEETLSSKGVKLLSLLPCSCLHEADLLYGAGVRGLLRFLARYSALRQRIRNPLQRRGKMRAFLETHYTVWAVREMIVVHELLMGGVGEKLGLGLGCSAAAAAMAAAGSEGKGVVEMFLAVGAVFEIPDEAPWDVEGWLVQWVHDDDDGVAAGEDHREFFTRPASEAIRGMIEGGRESWEKVAGEYAVFSEDSEEEQEEVGAVHEREAKERDSASEEETGFMARKLEERKRGGGEEEKEKERGLLKKWGERIGLRGTRRRVVGSF